MALWVPPVSFGAVTSNATDEASVAGTQLTAHATPHTKGSYTELIASTPFDASLANLLFSSSTATGFDTSMLVDIAVGAAASEVVVLPNLAAGYAQNTVSGGGQRYEFPLFIPAGSRISARVQAAITVDTVNVHLWLYGKPSAPVWVGRKVTAYGADLATSHGPTITTSTSGEGGWAEIVASTSDPIRWLAAGLQGAANAALGNSSGLYDIGVGAAAAESAVVEHVWYQTTTAEIVTPPMETGWAINIAAGSRLAARAEATAAANIDAIFYGVS